jgi:hypothetical protein
MEGPKYVIPYLSASGMSCETLHGDKQLTNRSNTPLPIQGGATVHLWTLGGRRSRSNRSATRATGSVAHRRTPAHLLLGRQPTGPTRIQPVRLPLPNDRQQYEPPPRRVLDVVQGRVVGYYRLIFS